MGGRFGGVKFYDGRIPGKASVRAWKTTRVSETYADPNIETGVPAAQGDIPIPLLIGRRMVTNFNTIWTGVPRTTTETVRKEPTVIHTSVQYWGLLSFPSKWGKFLIGKERDRYLEKNPDLVEEETTITTVVDFAIGLCMGPDVFVLKLEDSNGNPIWENFEVGPVRLNIPAYCDGIDFYSGDDTQPVNAVMLAKDGPALTPAYNGLCYMVIEGVPIGDDISPLMALGIELFRPVNPLGLDVAVAQSSELDQNIANAIVEIFTFEFAVKMPFDYIDADTFTACAVTLANEENWASVLVSQHTEAKNVIAALLSQADGCLRWNPAKGKYEMVLYREDFDIALLPDFGVDNVASVSGFSKPQWKDVPQAAIIQYTDRTHRYNQGSIGVKINEHIPEFALKTVVERFDNIMTNEVAAVVLPRVVGRTLTPMLEGSIETGRDAADLLPGDPVKLTWPDMPGVVDFPMFIIDKREIGATGDSYSLLLGQALSPAGNLRRPAPPALATPTNEIPVAPLESEIEIKYMPLFFLRQLGSGFADGGNENSPTLYVPMFVVTGGSQAFKIVGINDDFDEYELTRIASKVLVGTTVNPILATDGYADGDISIDTTIPTRPDSLYNPGRKFGGYALVGDEIVQFYLALDGGSGVQLYECKRGLFDTVPKAHPAGTPVYVLPNFSMISRYGLTMPGDFYIEAFGMAGLKQSPGSEFFEVTGMDTTRALLPACPQNAQINATNVNNYPRDENPVINLGSQYYVTWEERNRLLGTIKYRGEGSQEMTEATTYDVVLKSIGNTTALASGVTGDSVQVTIPAGLTTGAATIEITATNAHGASRNKEIVNLTLA